MFGAVLLLLQFLLCLCLVLGFCCVRVVVLVCLLCVGAVCVVLFCLGVFKGCEFAVGVSVGFVVGVGVCWCCLNVVWLLRLVYV